MGSRDYVRRSRNGKTILDTYVVTVRLDHYVTVQAADPDQAADRAVAALVDRHGRGHNPTVTEIERHGVSDDVAHCADA